MEREIVIEGREESVNQVGPQGHTLICYELFSTPHRPYSRIRKLLKDFGGVTAQTREWREWQGAVCAKPRQMGTRLTRREKKSEKKSASETGGGG